LIEKKAGNVAVGEVNQQSENHQSTIAFPIPPAW
jgi:hypothetical protein